MRPRKQLSLQQALNVTKKPLDRPGNLIQVQVVGAYELKNRFVPSSLDPSVTAFPQPETETYIRDLYAADGRLESLAAFNDIELAAFYRYAQSGTKNGKPETLGDRSEFERNVQEYMEALPVDTPQQIRDIVFNIIIDLHQKYAADAVYGRASRVSQKTKAGKVRAASNDIGQSLDDVIRGLAREHREMRANEVWPHLKTAIEEWSGDSVAETGQGDSRSYRYAHEGKADSIMYNTFRKKLAVARKTR